MTSPEDMKRIDERLQYGWASAYYLNIFATARGVCVVFDCHPREEYEERMAYQRLQFFVRDDKGVLREETNIIV